MLEIANDHVPASVALEMLALESENSNNILKSAVNLIPSVMSDLSNSMNGLLELGKVFSFSDLKSKLHSTFFTARPIPEDVLRKLFVPIPEGFIGNYDSYQNSLFSCIEYYEDVTVPMLREFYVTVAAFVTNKDRKLSIKDDVSKYKKTENERSKIIKEVSAHFNKGITGRALFHEVFNDFTEFKKVCNDNNTLIKRLDHIDLKRVASQVKKIVDTLDIAIKSAQNGDYDKASNEALMNLATGTYELAQQVEFFSVTAYRIKALTFAISEAESKVKAL